MFYQGADGKPTLTQAGWVRGPNFEQPKAVGLINLTGSPLKVDLMSNSAATVKDIDLGARTEVMAPIKV